MNKLIVRIDMFTTTQMAYITTNGGEVVKTFAINTSRFEQDVMDICEQENVTNIVISGPVMYTKGFEKRIRQRELVKYEKHKLDIQLIK
jgi:hypothetical protein